MYLPTALETHHAAKEFRCGCFVRGESRGEQLKSRSPARVRGTDNFRDCRVQSPAFPFGGMQIETLSSEILLLLLCAHGTKHCWRRLRYVCDIADLIKTSKNLNWTKLLRNADQVGARRMVLTGLSLAHDLLEAPVPDEILGSIRASRPVQRIATESSIKIIQNSRKEPGQLARSNTIPGHGAAPRRSGFRDSAVATMAVFALSMHSISASHAPSHIARRTCPSEE